MKHVIMLVGAMVAGCANVQTSTIETQSLKPQPSKTIGNIPAFDPKAQEAANLAIRKAHCGNRHVMHQNDVNLSIGVEH